MYIVPPTTIGLTCIVDRSVASPVRYSQAGRSVCTLMALIWASAANWFPFGSPRYTGHSVLAASATRAGGACIAIAVAASAKASALPTPSLPVIPSPSRLEPHRD